MRCAHCGCRNDDRARFCVRCRQPLRGVPTQTQGADRHEAAHARRARIAPRGPRLPELNKNWIAVTSLGLAAVVAVTLLITLRPWSREPVAESLAEAARPQAPAWGDALDDDGPIFLERGQKASPWLNGAAPAGAFAYAVDRAEVAAVSESGEITALAAGEALLTVTETTTGQRALCSLSVAEPATLTDFTMAEQHMQGHGRQLDGLVVAASPLKAVGIRVTSGNYVAIDESVQWEEGQGPRSYDFNDSDRNLNQKVGFRQLEEGAWTISVWAATQTQAQIDLGSWDFEVYVPVFPYRSALDATAYPTLMPDEWSDWLQAKDCNSNIDPVFAGRLAALGKAHNKKVVYISGFRTLEKQKELYRAYLNGTGNLAGTPGSSWHEFGAAVDATDWVCDLGEKEMRKYGLCKPVSGENWHIQPIEASHMDKEDFYNAYSSKKYPKYGKNCYIRVE